MGTPRKISFLLLMGLSILLGHNLVPHDHHSESPAAQKTDSCPIEHQDHHEGEADNNHCHAFNNIEFINYYHSEEPVPDQISIDLFIAHIYCESERGHSKATSGYICLKTPAYSVNNQGPHYLRGPPAQV